MFELYVLAKLMNKQHKIIVDQIRYALHILIGLTISVNTNQNPETKPTFDSMICHGFVRIGAYRKPLASEDRAIRTSNTKFYIILLFFRKNCLKSNAKQYIYL